MVKWVKFPTRKELSAPGLTWHDLDVLYYNKFPDEWDGDLYLQGENYERILAAGSGETARRSRPGEERTGSYIANGDWRIWQVGRVYLVADRSAKRGELDRHVLGRLKLVGIEHAGQIDRLRFEVITEQAFLEERHG